MWDIGWPKSGSIKNWGKTMEKEIKLIQKVWETGKSKVVTIPDDVIKEQNIKKGDRIAITIMGSFLSFKFSSLREQSLIYPCLSASPYTERK